MNDLPRPRSLSKGKLLQDRLLLNANPQINLVEYKRPTIQQDLNDQLRCENAHAAYNHLLKSRILPSRKPTAPYKPYIYSDEPMDEPIRHIAKTPYKILDAPKLKDDFYYSLVDWSLSNQIAVGLDNSVYTWNAKTNETTQLMEIEYPTQISSLKWCNRSEHLAIGDEFGCVRIFDVQKAKMLRSYENHSQRVGCLDWNGHSITSGSRDKSIYLADVRCPNNYQIQFQNHKQEVCGIQWSHCEGSLASGGNDNHVLVQSVKMANQALYTFKDHTAAVKALAWSPHQANMLCTGGGTTDKCLKFWNTSTGTLIKSQDTGSQICNMKWSTNSNELVTTHGFSLNQIGIWRVPKLERIATLYGHSFRVLYLALSADGESIVTGSGDETLRFWKVFPQRHKHQTSFNQSNLSIELR